MASDAPLRRYTCPSCQKEMGYPEGSILVQCAGCRTVTNVAGAGTAIHVPCVSCDLLLAFPPGTKLASCPTCTTVFRIATEGASGGDAGLTRRTSVAVPAGQADAKDAQTGEATENSGGWVARAVHVENTAERQALADAFDAATSMREQEWQGKARR